MIKIKNRDHLSVTILHLYEVQCFGVDGTLKWSDKFENLVTTAGLNKYLDATLKTGLTSPAWYVGLVTGPDSGNTYLAANTMGSHAGWTENTTYSQGTRPAWTPGTVSAGSVSNVASKASFSITGTVNLAGCFVADNSTKGGSTGTLLGVGGFSGLDRSAINGETVVVTVTMSMVSS